jgi:hypothetical protein
MRINNYFKINFEKSQNVINFTLFRFLSMENRIDSSKGLPLLPVLFLPKQLILFL